MNDVYYTFLGPKHIIQHIPPSNIIFLIVLLKFNFWVACQPTKMVLGVYLLPLMCNHYCDKGPCNAGDQKTDFLTPAKPGDLNLNFQIGILGLVHLTHEGQRSKVKNLFMALLDLWPLKAKWTKLIVPILEMTDLNWDLSVDFSQTFIFFPGRDKSNTFFGKGSYDGYKVMDINTAVMQCVNVVPI